MSRPDIAGQQVIQAIQFLTQPMVGIEVKELRTAFRAWQRQRDLPALLEAVEALKEQRGTEALQEASQESVREQLGRGQLRLICFDLVTGG